MASADLQNDLSICSICFEKFKTPKILPCLHIFCHSCITSYIASSCQSKEAPVGFSCPLCRKFIPAPNDIGKPDKWADGLPFCEIIAKIVKIRERKLCLPCQREDEEEEATKICVTCEEPICGNCAKYHRRNLTSRTHVIVPMNSIEPSILLKYLMSYERNGGCSKHPEKEIELHCGDHQQPCCTLCVGTEHSKCSNMETIPHVTVKTKERCCIQILLDEISAFEKRLHAIKERQEYNITLIDSSSDNIKENIKMLRKKINDHLDRLEDEHLNELSKITKQSRMSLSTTIDSVSDRIHYSRHCIQSLQSLQNLEDASDACFMKEYHRVRESFKALKTHSMTLQIRDMKLDSKVTKEANEIANMKYISAIKVVQSKYDILSYTVRFPLCLAFEFDLGYEDVYSGVLSSDGMLTLAKYGSSRSGLQQYNVILENDNSKPSKEYMSGDYFFGLVSDGNLFYATNRTENCVTIISSETFKFHGIISIDDSLTPYGICQWREYLFVACQTAILKYSMSGHFIQSYPVDFNTLFVIVTNSGNMVYTNSHLNFVVSLNPRGKLFWKYVNQKLRLPHGIDKDEMDNLYVASTEMNSVHILSCDGAVIRIIEDIPRPVFMKVQESSRTCCVCSNFRKIKVYKLKYNE